MEPKLIEIARSFSYKMSLPGYENRDFFCSAKQEVLEKEAVKTSNDLFEFCREEVMKSVEEYKEELLKIPKPIDKKQATLDAENVKAEEVRQEEPLNIHNVQKQF